MSPVLTRSSIQAGRGHRGGRMQLDVVSSTVDGARKERVLNLSPSLPVLYFKCYTFGNTNKALVIHPLRRASPRFSKRSASGHVCMAGCEENFRTRSLHKHTTISKTVILKLP